MTLLAFIGILLTPPTIHAFTDCSQFAAQCEAEIKKLDMANAPSPSTVFPTTTSPSPVSPDPVSKSHSQCIPLTKGEYEVAGLCFTARDIYVPVPGTLPPISVGPGKCGGFNEACEQECIKDDHDSVNYLCHSVSPRQMYTLCLCDGVPKTIGNGTMLLAPTASTKNTTSTKTAPSSSSTGPTKSSSIRSIPLANLVVLIAASSLFLFE
ncbi:hypothetical protein HDU97_002961 [Phlyctochytrium planicorne]|nr:hypothetical protein HDU97_002961 [Phlyctochytrium planicorne]